MTGPLRRIAALGEPAVLPDVLRYLQDTVRAEDVRKRLAAGPPRRRFAIIKSGPTMCAIGEDAPARFQLRVMVSTVWVEKVLWLHGSVSRNTMPTYEDLKLLHAALWPDGHAYQYFVPPDEHYNHHETTLHLWGRADGAAALPDMRDPETGGV